MLNKQTAKLIAVIAQNLPEMSDEAMQRHIDDPKGVQNILRQAFMTFPILMTVKLGTGLKSADDFRQALKKAGMKLDDWVSDLLNHPAFKTADQPIELSIVAPTVAELGFKDGARYADICQRGLELGYGLCPPELGPQLRLQYKNQPKGEVLLLVMKAIRGSIGFLDIFVVKHDGNGQWLEGSGTFPDGFFNSDFRIVFVRRK